MLSNRRERQIKNRIESNLDEWMLHVRLDGWIYSDSTRTSQSHKRTGEGVRKCKLTTKSSPGTLGCVCLPSVDDWLPLPILISVLEGVGFRGIAPIFQLLPRAATQWEGRHLIRNNTKIIASLQCDSVCPVVL